jgi:hypothetical protein
VDDVLFGYRLQLVDLAGRIGVAAACRTFGVHRSTYYAWKRKIDRKGADQRRGQVTAQDDPRRVLAARLRPLPAGPLPRTAPRPPDYLRYYNFERAHTGRLTRGPIPADIVYGARKIDAR